MPAFVTLTFFFKAFPALKKTHFFRKFKNSVKFLPFEGKKYYSFTQSIKNVPFHCHNDKIITHSMYLHAKYKKNHIQNVAMLHQTSDKKSVAAA